MVSSPPGSKTRSKWRLWAWVVWIGCVALIAALIVEGLFTSSAFTLKAEVFAGVFAVGCAVLLFSRRSAKAAGRDAQRRK